MMLNLVITTADGRTHTARLDSIWPEMGNQILTSIELRAESDPIVRVPFSVHGPERTLHTVCRENGSIDRVEW